MLAEAKLQLSIVLIDIFRVMLPTRGRNADYKLWYERVIIIDIQY